MRYPNRCAMLAANLNSRLGWVLAWPIGVPVNVATAKLRILNAGQSYGGGSGGHLVSGGSSVVASSNLIISGSLGQESTLPATRT